MALTVGTTRYDDSNGHTLTDLLSRPEVKVAIRQYFEKDALANALRKLEGWINGPSWLKPWRKGQNKSFATASEMVLWLKYKSEKVFQPHATREKELAELINDCPGIRTAVADFIKIHLVREFNDVPKDTRDRISRVTGRYAHFYSKIFFSRNLGEGLSYFKNQRNPSLSEMAAFLGDFGLAAKEHTKQCIIMTKGHNEIRTNQAQVDAAVAEAMRQLDRHPEYRELEALVGGDDAGPRLRKLERQISTEMNRVKSLFQNDATVLDDIRRDPNAFKYFNQFKALPQVQQHQFGDDTAAFSSEMWRTYKAALIIKLDQSARNRIALADKVFNDQLNTGAAGLTALRDHAKQLAVGTVSRGNHNVVVNHQWTKIMMERNQVIGAGPSSTTAITLGLVDYCIGGDENRFAVAASLFAFWQRKKHILRISAAVHTWNEVMTALDNYLPSISSYKVPLDYSASDEMQCKIYEYPDSFLKNGLPIFSSNGTI